MSEKKSMEPQLFLGKMPPERDSMQSVKNKRGGWMKPTGGLWTSTYLRDTSYGSSWGEWCVENAWCDISACSWSVLTPSPDTRIALVDTLRDLKKLVKRYGFVTSAMTFLDFEAMAQDYDAMHLTEEGQWRTRLTYPESLYGWDCESTLWF